MRKHYLDNLRWTFVLMLFPYHIFMIYNSFGEGFYIKGPDIPLTTGFIAVTWPWFMPLLFVIAGVSSFFALQKRTLSQYIRERINKLLYPLFFGVLLVVPAQTFFAERFHNGYTGGYFEQYLLFFTKPTDLTGYTGGFTPGHLWFILYLFIISLVALPIMNFYMKSGKRFPLQRISAPVLLTLFICPTLGSLALDIGGKSVGEYLAYFLLGFFVLSDESILAKIDRVRLALLGISLTGAVCLWIEWNGVISGISDIAYDIFSRFYAWTTILALIGLGRHYLNFRNRITDYFSQASFSTYIFHQTWIIVAAYYTFRITDSVPLQMILILLVSFILTFVTYELCKRLRITRLLFAISNKNLKKM